MTARLSLIWSVTNSWQIPYRPHTSNPELKKEKKQIKTRRFRGWVAVNGHSWTISENTKMLIAGKCFNHDSGLIGLNTDNIMLGHRKKIIYKVTS